MEKKETVRIRPLSKRTDLGKNDPYVAYLINGLKDKNIKNIGVFGTYGSGKSSVVGSFIKESRKNALYFSQDTFNKYIVNINNKQTIDIRSAIYKELLSYTTSSLKLNEYLKTLFNRKSDYILYPVLFLSFIASSVFLAFYLNQFFGWLSYILAVLAFLLEILIVLLFNSKRIKELNVNIGKAVSFLVDSKEETIKESIKDHPATIENIIIRILKSKRIKFFVIEDIERLETVDLEIVNYIREFKILNDIINRSNEYARNPIIFIFGLKDWCIGDSEKRTKYFDLIVPVVPYSSFSNAEDSLLLDATIKEDISRDLVFDVSNYFLNQRQINALITEYELTKSKTFSKGLENELFALSALNVLFPQVYCLLFYKNNFLDRTLSEDVSDDSLLNNLKAKIKADLDNVKAFERFSETDCEKILSGDAPMFIKTCIINKFISHNYEKLLCSNVENAIFKQDREIIKKIRSSESITDDEILDPKSLISSFHDKEKILFSDKKFLNIDLARFVATSGSNVLKKQLASLVGHLNQKELTSFIDKYMDKYHDNDVDNLILLLVDNPVLYSSCSKAKNALEACYYCFKYSNYNILQSKAKEIGSFFDIINSKDFAPNYGREIKPEKYREIAPIGVLCLEDISPFVNDKEHIKVFKELCLYSINYSNLSTIYSDLSNSPIHYIASNNKIQSKMISNASIAVEVLDKCVSVNTRDTAREVISFALQFSDDQIGQVLNSKYFDGWELKIDASLFDPTKKHSNLLKRGLFDISSSGFISNTISNYPKSIQICIEKTADKIQNSCVFEEIDSWSLVFGIENTKIVKSISKSLSLSNVKNYATSAKNKQVILCYLDCLKEEEKNNYLQLIEENDKELFLKGIKDKVITPDDLSNIKLNPEYIDSFLEEDISLGNLFVLEQNANGAIKHIQENKDTDYGSIFFDKKGEAIKCDNLDLIIEYCCSGGRNFDKVVKIVVSLDSSYFTQKEKWHRFIHSFEDSSQKDYCYFKQYDNNNIVLNKLADNNIVSRPVVVASRGQYKSKLL